LILSEIVSLTVESIVFKASNFNIYFFGTRLAQRQRIKQKSFDLCVGIIQKYFILQQKGEHHDQCKDNYDGKSQVLRAGHIFAGSGENDG
jgi:hypothetical protein